CAKDHKVPAACQPGRSAKMPSLRGLRGTRNACLLLMLLLVSVAAAKQPLVAQSVESAPPGTQLEEEADAIVVVGERLRRARGAIGINPITGRMKCKVTNPSGDDRVDRAACD